MRSYQLACETGTTELSVLQNLINIFWPDFHRGFRSQQKTFLVDTEAYCLGIMPRMIYGTAWKKEKTTLLVKQAISLGFRAVDTACQPKHYSEGLGIDE